MDSLELILFNVGHGLSVALIEYPEKYVTLVDLGCEEHFSPLINLSQTRQVRPDILYITHPHGDHLSDIDSALRPEYTPDFVNYQDYDWVDVVARERSSLVGKIEQFQQLVAAIPSGVYNGRASLRAWRWTPQLASELFGENNYVNNSSLFLIYKWQDFKIAIAGDQMSDAMDRLCNQENFVADAKNADILIAPHHGHSSPNGFPRLWPKTIGKPFVTLISVQSRDPNVDPGYRSQNFARGVTGVSSQEKPRYSLTTRDDGTISVTMWYDEAGKPSWSFGFE